MGHIHDDITSIFNNESSLLNVCVIFLIGRHFLPSVQDLVCFRRWSVTAVWLGREEQGDAGL